MKTFTVAEILDAMEKDPTPKSKAFFIDPYFSKTKSCAIGGASLILFGNPHSGWRLAEALGRIPVPAEEGDDTNLLSPNYTPEEEYLRPTLRKRIEYLSDGTNMSKKRIAQTIRKRYPELLNEKILVTEY